MLKNYVLIALRTLRSRPGYTLVNVGGLGLGLACAFLIVLFIQHERSFDRFHTQSDRIARVLLSWEGGPKASTPAGLAPDLATAFPEIEAAVRVDLNRRPYLRIGGESRRVSGYALADPSFFEVFDFELLRGDPATALEDPHSLVLTESAADVLFGEADPLGETVTYDDGTDLTVTGVVADPPPTSTLDFEYLGSFEIYREWWGGEGLSDYTNHNFLTYFLLQPGTDLEALEAKFAAWGRERFPSWFADEPADYEPVELQPLQAIHLTPSITFESLPTRDPSYLWVFGAVAVLIVLIAAVNFTNLATARAAQRAKEVGVRKAIGARQRQLVGQFLGESLLLSVLAIGLALGLVAVLLPAFNDAVGAGVTLGVGGLRTTLLLVGLGLATGLMAGAYPALYLSAFRPARVLKGEVSRGRGGFWLRRGLIVFQFAASVVLIVGALTVHRQLDYMQTRDLGFEGEQVLFFSQAPGLHEQYVAFRQELLASPQIQNVAWSTPPGRVGTNRGYKWPGQADGEEDGESLWTIIAGPGYLETMGVELVAGREFVSLADTHDTYILNQTAVEALGIEDPVGHPFRAWDRPMGEVIGVAKDFHFQSLHSAVEPVVINYKPDWVGTIAVRTAAGGVGEALDHVRATWAAFAPGYAFEYHFLDEDFGRAYEAEAQLVQRFGFFAGIAIFIACLGLFGLAAYTAEQRRKEIGVRKVLGASVPQIMRLLAGEFARLVLVGFVLAAPVAYLAMDRWLGDFAYRVGLGPGVFVLAGGVALLVALAAVSSQAVRAATADPVRALRYE
jgi:putative ABC transport system permease protein